jgi:inorganic pyrophosphatase
MPKKQSRKATLQGSSPSQLRPFDSDDPNLLQVIVETPRGSRNKFAYDPEQYIFVLKKVLPAGMVFPYDFGFVPSTKADDGDPIDVLVLLEEPVAVGCLTKCRLIGALLGEQRGKGERKFIRNDRLLAVEHASQTYSEINNISEVSQRLLHELEQFFVQYQALSGAEFRPLGRKGPNGARKLLDNAIQ